MSNVVELGQKRIEYTEFWKLDIYVYNPEVVNKLLELSRDNYCDVYVTKVQKMELGL